MKYKAKLSYSNEGITIHTFSNEKLVKWVDIELIFLINSVPLDGEYHNKEFRIYTNTEPIYINQSKISWFEKIFPPPKYKYPLIKIDDYYFVNFNSLYAQLCIHLGIKNFNKKIINEPLQTFKVYLLYDKGSFINDIQINNLKSQSIK
ncbi:hypothetical protein ACTS94_02725 [Empedobacter falsenii]